MHQPGREPGATHLDQVRPLVRHDAAGRAGGEHEAIRLLGGDRRAVEAIAADAARLEDLVAGAGDNDRLPEAGMPLHVLRLLQQVGPHSARGLAEEFRDVQDAELGRGPETRRQVDVRDVERGARPSGGDDLEVRHPSRRGVSQSSPRGGRSCHSSYRDSYSPTPERAPRSRSGCRRAVGRSGGQRIHRPGDRAVSGNPRTARSAARPTGCPPARLPARPPVPHPSGNAPVRNGLVRRSTPMVVSGPCPLCTTVESGSDRNWDWMLPMSVA